MSAGYTPGPWKNTGQVVESCERFAHITFEDRAQVELHFYGGSKADAEARFSLMLAAPELRGLVEKAVDALSTYIIPDSGITEHDVLNQLLGIFDGPEYRAVIAKATDKEAI